MRIIIALLAVLVLAPVVAEAVQATVQIQTQAVDPNRSGIRVERNANGGSFSSQGTLPTDGTVFNQTGLVLGTAYCYRLIPFGALGDGPTLGPACGTPGLPGALTGPITIIFAP